jgi:hypothetical protein
VVADSLERQVVSLQDSIVKLEAGKSLALDAGYGNAFAAYNGGGGVDRDVD